MLNYIVTTNKNISFVAKSKDENYAGVVPPNHPNYDKILEELRKKGDKPSRQIKRLKMLMDTLGEVKLKINGIKVYGNDVTYNDKVIHNIVVDKIFEFTREGYDIKPLVAFLDKLLQNPSQEAVETLYNWLEKAGLIIDQDGDILGYKSVRMDYFDHHSGTISNAIGRHVIMPRENVSCDRGLCAGPGLYVGTLNYATNFHTGFNRIMVVKVHPKDVVIVPDSEHEKMKTCGYKVIAELTDDNIKLLDQGDYVTRSC